jgi:hypothetical protein
MTVTLQVPHIPFFLVKQGQPAILLRPWPCWHLIAHLGSYPVNVPRRPAPLGRHDALGRQDLTDRLMVALTVELGIGQYQGNGHSPVGDIDQRAQGGAVMGRAAARGLRENQSPVDIHDHDPLEPVAPGQALASILGSRHEERPDGTRCEASRVHRHRGLAVRRRHQPVDGGSQDLLQRRFVESAENTVDGGIIGPVP